MGYLITFEGGEGCGKTTQVQMLKGYLLSKGYDVMLAREPGSTAIGEQIRSILLDAKNSGFDARCEMLLYLAARAQYTRELIIPQLKKPNGVFISDRYTDSTAAYQGYGRGFPLEFIHQCNRFATDSVFPNLTIIIDVDVETGFASIKREKDRIELEAAGFHQRVNDGYRRLAADFPDRIKVVEYLRENPDAIQEEIKKHVNQLLGIK